jgi:ribose transport system ATP-binding protein
VLLELVGLTGLHKPDEVSFTLHRGEVLGLAGLLGSGRSALARVIAGIEPAVTGDMRIKGEKVAIRRPADAIAHGVALVPEARATQGIIPAHSLADNMAMAVIGRISPRGIVDRSRVRAVADKMIQRLSIKTASQDHAVSTLSGGNQQKIVVAREMERKPALLLIGQPTRGVDIGAIEFIHQQIVALRDAGTAVLLVSVELDEIMSLSDRIALMFDGQLMGFRDPAQTNERELGLLMAGMNGEAA